MEIAKYRRLWRVRKLNSHIDAEVRDENGLEVQLLYGDRVIYRRRWGTMAEAEADAACRLADLQRAGWTEHW
jgi:hypothetical protein